MAGPSPAARLPVLLLAVVLALAAALDLSASAPAPAPRFGPTHDPAALARALVGAMDDTALAGQVLMMTWPGATPPQLLLDWVRERHIGGVKVFGWNGKDTVEVARAVAILQREALRSGAGIPLLVATDQEGGTVRHIKGTASRTSGAMALGATALAAGTDEDARRSGYLIGRELSAMGVTMNFAPVVDLATKPQSHLIGPRAFSDDPRLVARLGAAFAQGLEAAGVIPVAKHFPGHGDTEADSHGRLPVIDIDRRTLRNRELVPFATLVGRGIPAVMAGHLSFPRVDTSGLPATVSRVMLSDILRKDLGFRGVVISDDLYMHGAGSTSTISASVKASIEAGIDLVMVSRLLAWNDAIWLALLQHLRTDPAFRTRIIEAATRIVEMKLRYLAMDRSDPLVPLPPLVPSRVPDPEAPGFFLDQARRSATLISGAQLLPFAKDSAPLVVSPFPEFSALAGSVFPRARIFRYSYRPLDAPDPSELAAFKKLSLKNIDVLVCVASAAGAAYASQAVASGARVGVVSADSPIWTAGIPRQAAIVAVYGDSRDAFRAGLEVLSGALPARGRLPIKMPDSVATGTASARRPEPSP